MTELPNRTRDIPPDPRINVVAWHDGMKHYVWPKPAAEVIAEPRKYSHWRTCFRAENVPCKFERRHKA